MLDSRDDECLRSAAQFWHHPLGLEAGGGTSDSGCWTPTPFTKKNKNKNNRCERVCQSVHLQQTSRAVLVFPREVSVECVCRFQTSVLLNHVCIVPTASVFAASPSEPPLPSPVRFFIGCPGSFTNLLKMQSCWPFEWDSQIFFTW